MSDAAQHDPNVEVLDDLDDSDGFKDETEQSEYLAGIRSTIRAKWTMDGATTLSEAADLLRQTADALIAMEGQGWQLLAPVNDDYGFIRRPPGDLSLTSPAANG